MNICVPVSQGAANSSQIPPETHFVCELRIALHF